MLCACMYTFIAIYVCIACELFTIKTTRCIQMPSFHTAVNILYTAEQLKLREEESHLIDLVRTVSRCDLHFGEKSESPCLRDEEEKASVWKKSAQGSGEPTVVARGRETS